MSMTLKLDVSKFKAGFKAYQNAYKKAHQVAMLEAGKKLLQNVDKSIGTEVSPPILTGALRGSGAVHVEGVFKFSMESEYPAGTPNTGNTTKKLNEVTVSYNTPYASRWHENPFTPGPVSQTYPNVGDKYLERHLFGDKDDIFNTYALFIRKGTNN